MPAAKPQTDDAEAGDVALDSGMRYDDPDVLSPPPSPPSEPADDDDFFSIGEYDIDLDQDVLSLLADGAEHHGPDTWPIPLTPLEVQNEPPGPVDSAPTEEPTVALDRLSTVALLRCDECLSPVTSRSATSSSGNSPEPPPPPSKPSPTTYCAACLCQHSSRFRFDTDGLTGAVNAIHANFYRCRICSVPLCLPRHGPSISAVLCQCPNGHSNPSPGSWSRAGPPPVLVRPSAIDAAVATVPRGPRDVSRVCAFHDARSTFDLHP